MPWESEVGGIAMMCSVMHPAPSIGGIAANISSKTDGASSLAGVPFSFSYPFYCICFWFCKSEIGCVCRQKVKTCLFQIYENHWPQCTVHCITVIFPEEFPKLELLLLLYYYQDTGLDIIPVHQSYERHT